MSNHAHSHPIIVSRTCLLLQSFLIYPKRGRKKCPRQEPCVTGAGRSGKSRRHKPAKIKKCRLGDETRPAKRPGLRRSYGIRSADPFGEKRVSLRRSTPLCWRSLPEVCIVAVTSPAIPKLVTVHTTHPRRFDRHITSRQIAGERAMLTTPLSAASCLLAASPFNRRCTRDRLGN
jgi:hypothetical protein